MRHHILFVLAFALSACGNMTPMPTCQDDQKYDGVTGNCMPTADEGNKMDGGQMMADMTPSPDQTPALIVCELMPELVGTWKNCQLDNGGDLVVCQFTTTVKDGICLMWCKDESGKGQFSCPKENVKMQNDGSFLCTKDYSGQYMPFCPPQN